MAMTTIERRKAENADERARRLIAIEETQPWAWGIYQDIVLNLGDPEYFRSEESGHAIKLGVDDGTFVRDAAKPTNRADIPDPAPNSRRAKANGADVRKSATPVVSQGVPGMARQQLLRMVGLQKGG